MIPKIRDIHAYTRDVAIDDGTLIFARMITGAPKDARAVPLPSLAGVEASVVAPDSPPIPALVFFHTLVLVETWAEWAARKGMANTAQQRRRLGGSTPPAQLRLGLDSAKIVLYPRRDLHPTSSNRRKSPKL